jgi:predicted ATPase
MLTHLHIKGYKCLDDCELPLAPLTLLSGPNASGKSTVIQAILLAFSGIEQKNVSYLKEAVKPFSHFEEIYCRYSDAREIRIDLAVNNKDHYTAIMDRSGLNTTTYPDTISFGYEQNLFYLCAGRSGPEELSEINRDIRIGQHGQFALGLLEQRKDKPVHQALVHRNAHANTLKAQLAWWLSFIVGVETEANTEKVTASTVKTTFQTEGLEDISPFNTGAGNSFLLKLMVMCLTSSPGDLLLIENPEIHLHPGAQSRLGCMLGFLAARGVQAVVETHCEHLINRVRYEIYTHQLPSVGAVIHYKAGVREAFETLYVNERGHFCDREGNEKAFPTGFFDTTLAELLEMG